MPKLKKPSLITRSAVVMEPEEKKIHTLIQRINTIANEKQRKKRIKSKEVHDKHMKKLKAVGIIDQKMSKERRKEHYKAEGRFDLFDSIGKKRAREEKNATVGNFKKKQKGISS